MDIISYLHKSVELLFQILGLVEVGTRRSMELSPERRQDLPDLEIYRKKNLNPFAPKSLLTL
jgi:hypothetical protein